MPIDFRVQSILREKGCEIREIIVAASLDCYRCRWVPGMQFLGLTEVTERNIDVGIRITIDNKHDITSELMALAKWIGVQDNSPCGVEVVERIQNVIKSVNKYIVNESDSGFLG